MPAQTGSSIHLVPACGEEAEAEEGLCAPADTSGRQSLPRRSSLLKATLFVFRSGCPGRGLAALQHPEGRTHGMEQGSRAEDRRPAPQGSFFDVCSSAPRSLSHWNYTGFPSQFSTSLSAEAGS